MSAGDNLNSRLFDPGHPQPRRLMPEPGGWSREQTEWDPNFNAELDTAEEVIGGDLVVRAPTRALGHISRGGLRTQHETNTSGGAYNPSYRREIERDVLGFDDHPVYGQIENPATRGMRDAGEHYGEHRFTLGREAKSRSTVIEGDSLYEGSKQPASISDIESGRKLVPKNASHGGLDYIEAQIHAVEGDPQRAGEEFVSYSPAVAPSRFGKVTRRETSRVPLEDIRSLDIQHRAEYLPDRSTWSRDDLVNLGQQFQDQGVSTWHHTPRRSYQPPLPYNRGELRDQGFQPSNPQVNDPLLAFVEEQGAGKEPDAGLMYRDSSIPGVQYENVGKFTEMKHQSRMRP